MRHSSSLFGEPAKLRQLRSPLCSLLARHQYSADKIQAKPGNRNHCSILLGGPLCPNDRAARLCQMRVPFLG